MSRILIVEDEERIANFVAKGLRALGQVTTALTRGDLAVEAILQGQYDLVPLDVGLPGKDGITVLEEVRGSGGRTPIIMLTAHSSLDDTVRGLDTGADDYITKPFRFDELLARIRVRLREKDTSATESMVVTTGEVNLDLRTRRITVDGETYDLSAREIALAEEFVTHPDQVLSREQLLSRVWGYDYDPGSNVVDVYVRYLRAKLGHARIQTVRGVGYRFVA